MKTSYIIAGLAILSKYNPTHEYFVYAEHDQISATTEKPLNHEDFRTMRVMGWMLCDTQDELSYEDYMENVDEYNLILGWQIYV